MLHVDRVLTRDLRQLRTHDFDGGHGSRYRIPAA